MKDRNDVCGTAVPPVALMIIEAFCAGKSISPVMSGCCKAQSHSGMEANPPHSGRIIALPIAFDTSISFLVRSIFRTVLLQPFCKWKPTAAAPERYSATTAGFCIRHRRV